MNADGTEQRQLTDSATFAVEPTFSPDGGTIAFEGFTSSYEIFTMDADGACAANVTNNSGVDMVPGWTPPASSGSVPVNASPPTVSGSAREYGVLSVSDGSWTNEPNSRAYQWQRCNSDGFDCIDVPDATQSTFHVATEDVGYRLRVRVTATGPAGSAQATSDPTATIVPGQKPGNISPPEVSGPALEGSLLSTSEGSWSGDAPITYAYKWRRCDSQGEACTAIVGAVARDYRLAPTDIGHRIEVIVHARNRAGEAEAQSSPSAVVQARPPLNTRAPTISGSALEGRRLVASPGSWTGTRTMSFAYVWRRCNARVLRQGDVGHRMRVAVTARNVGGSKTLVSSASRQVAGR